HGVEDQGHVAARPVEMRLDHLQRKGGGDRGGGGVAAALEGAHADRRGDPMRGGDHAGRAGELGTGGERGGIDGVHGAGLPMALRATLEAADLKPRETTRLGVAAQVSVVSGSRIQPGISAISLVSPAESVCPLRATSTRSIASARSPTPDRSSPTSWSPKCT